MTSDGAQSDPDAPGDKPPRPDGKTRVDAAALRLGLALQLSERVRHAARNEIAFLIVNETRQLLPYRQAALWTLERGAPRLAALSGLAIPDPNSPYVLWMNKLARRLLSKPAEGARQLHLPALAAEDKAPRFLADWKEWLPENILAAPLMGHGGWVAGFLLLARETAFRDSERILFSHVADAYGESLGAALTRPRPISSRRWFWRVAGAVLLALAAVFLMMPRPQSALARAEVTARRPAIVRSGMDGVVERFLVEPNQRVKKGDPLLRLEDIQLRTRLAVAEKAEEMARVELRQLQQAALGDPRSKARLPLAQRRVEQLQAESEYVKSLLDRVEALSPMDGAALVDNPDEWLGRPVGLGQKIMMVADPDDVMLEISLPIADSLPIEPGAELLFFPNIAPASPVRAKVTFVSYRAVETPGVGMAFLLRAEFPAGAGPMLGLRGTARLSGPPLPLGLIILRRPIMAVRQWLGW